MRSLLILALAPTASALAAAPFAPRGAMMAARAPQLARTPLFARPRVGSPPVAQEAVAADSGGPSNFEKFSELFANLFPVWTASVAALGLINPAILGGIPTSAFTALLGMLMLSMGITLTVDDFKRCLERPVVILLGFICCYGLMPLMALGLSSVLGLSPAMTAGMVLVGSINGGQASNLCTYIAKGDVALSVLMTTVTTIGAIFMTPLLCKLLLGAVVAVDATGVAISTVQVVLFPILAGMTINAKAPELVKKIEPFSPIVGVTSTILLVRRTLLSTAALHRQSPLTPSLGIPPAALSRARSPRSSPPTLTLLTLPGNLRSGGLGRRPVRRTHHRGRRLASDRVRAAAHPRRHPRLSAVQADRLRREDVPHLRHRDLHEVVRVRLLPRQVTTPIPRSTLSRPARPLALSPSSPASLPRDAARGRAPAPPLHPRSATLPTSHRQGALRRLPRSRARGRLRRLDGSRRLLPRGGLPLPPHQGLSGRGGRALSIGRDGRVLQRAPWHGGPWDGCGGYRGSVACAFG